MAQRDKFLTDDDSEKPEFVNDLARIYLETRREAKRISENLAPKEPPYHFEPIVFGSGDSDRAIHAIFEAGTVIESLGELRAGDKIAPHIFFVPERTRKVLDTMGIPYEIVRLS